MSLQLATKLYENIGMIKHLRTYEFLKAIQENTDSSGWAKITYARWRDEFKLHAFILNECTDECVSLGFIGVARENKNGIAAEGGKGSKRIYRLTLDKVKGIPETRVETKKESPTVPSPEPAPEKKIEKPISANRPIKYNKGRNVAHSTAKPMAAKTIAKKSPAKTVGKFSKVSVSVSKIKKAKPTMK